MRYGIAFSILLMSACSQPGGVSFAERAERAESIEDTPAGVLFIASLLDDQGDKINKFIGECYATRPDLDKDSFTLVADIDREGNFTNVVVQPETAPSRCYADKIDRLRTKARVPAGFSGSSFPIVLRINYNK